MSALTTTAGQASPSRTVLPPGATPAGPAGYYSGWRGTTTTVVGSLSYRRTIAQSAARQGDSLKEASLISGVS